MLRRQDPQRRELQFAASNIPQIARHYGIGPFGRCQLDQMVVGFIRQIRPPSVEHFRPTVAQRSAACALRTVGEADVAFIAVLEGEQVCRQPLKERGGF